MSKKRKKTEILKDMAEIMEAAKTSHSYTEVSEKTGIPYWKIKTTLKNFPDEEEKFLKLMNKKRSKSPDFEDEGIVIDHSIINLPNMFEILERENRKKIIFSITAKELKKISETNQRKSGVAKKLLLKALTEGDKFQGIYIEEKEKSIEDQIIEECLKHKKYSILTENIYLALIAQGMGIEVKYIPYIEERKPRIQTFDLSKAAYDYSINMLIISPDGDMKTIEEVSIGDDIFVVKRKNINVVIFTHYRLLNEKTRSNVDFIFGKSIYENKINVPREYLGIVEQLMKEI